MSLVISLFVVKRTQTMATLYEKRLVSETEQQGIEQTQDLAAERQWLKQLKAGEAGVNDQISTLTEVNGLQRQKASITKELIKVTSE